MPRPALFLDRDGVILREKHFLATPEDVELIAGAAAAIRLANERAVPVVVVTNQSGVARGYCSEAALHRVHACMQSELLRAGAQLTRVYHCPHHPDHGAAPYRRDCDCRKPRAGMLLKAAADLGLDLARSVIVGDRLTDLEAGVCVGARGVLVRTGCGASVYDSLPADRRHTVEVADDLLAAVLRVLPALAGG